MELSLSGTFVLSVVRSEKAIILEKQLYVLFSDVNWPFIRFQCLVMTLCVALHLRMDELHLVSFTTTKQQHLKEGSRAQS